MGKENGSVSPGKRKGKKSQPSVFLNLDTSEGREKEKEKEGGG